MPASTASAVVAAVAMLSILLATPPQAEAGSPQVMVVSDTGLSRMDSVASATRELLTEELRRCGWYHLTAEENNAVYEVSISLLAFGSANRDSRLGFGSDLSDLQRKLGESSYLDQVKLLVEIRDPGTREVLCSRIVEGLESRKGTSISSENPAYYAGLNLSSDEFRRSSLGRAAYKAYGDALDVIYETLPLQGLVQAFTDDAVVLDLDASSGLAKGDDLSIVRDVPLLASDGTAVWHEYRRVGLARIIDFQPGHCLCLLLEGQGSVHEGDLAQPLLAPVWFPDEADSRN